MAAFLTRGQPIRSRRGRTEDLARDVQLALRAASLEHAGRVAGVVRDLAGPSPRRNAITVVVSEHTDATVVRFHDRSDRSRQLDEHRHHLLSRQAIRWSTLVGEEGRTISFEILR